MVSNLAAGTLAHKRAVFNEGAVPPLLHLLATSAFDVRKEAAYALGNLCVAPRDQGSQGKPILEHLLVLVDRGCLMGFIALVKSPDLEAARLGLQFLELVSAVNKLSDFHLPSTGSFSYVLVSRQKRSALHNPLREVSLWSYSNLLMITVMIF